jgi:folate-binding protein YgfZ
MNKDLALIRLDADTALLQARGTDVDTFLQGQLSNDVTRLSAGKAQLSSYNSPKGRMLAVLTLMRRDGGIDLELPRSIVEPVAKRLRMFVLRSKLTLAIATDEASLGLVGADVPAALAAAGLPSPAEALGYADAGELRVLRRFGETPRYSIHGPAAAIESLASRLGEAQPAGFEAWTRAQILAGEPVVGAQTQDRFVAQMANLDRLGGISFDKGCYTGQEIVARLHYLGQLKRRMFLCSGTGAAPEAGASIHQGAQEQSVGEVVQAAPGADGGFVASVVLQLSQAEADGLHVGETALSRPQAYAAD